MINSQSQ